tara:strand:- start:2163 stop:2555 length:393 start_codon:yes stop_codon:yes gene_type:complete
MTDDCVFSRQIESYLDCQNQEKVPRFLEEHYELCSKCKEKFVEKGNSFQQIESFIPFFSKKEIQLKEEELLYYMKKIPFKSLKKIDRDDERRIFCLTFFKRAVFEFASSLTKKGTIFPVFLLLVCLFILD